MKSTKQELEFAKKYRETHKEEIKQIAKKYYADNKEKYREHYIKNKEYYIKYSKNYKKLHKKEYILYFQKKNYERREQLFNKLGHNCVKCGNIDKRVLQFDHINGGGTKKRKHIGSNSHYKFLLELSNLKEEIQVLCANCNWIKRVENNEKRH